MTQLSSFNLLNTTCSALSTLGHISENLGLTGLYFNRQDRSALTAWAIGRTLKIVRYYVCNDNSLTYSLYNSYAELIIDMVRCASIIGLHHLDGKIQRYMKDVTAQRRVAIQSHSSKKHTPPKARPGEMAYSQIDLLQIDPVITQAQWIPFILQTIKTATALTSMLATNWIIFGQNRPTSNIDNEDIQLILKKYSIDSIGRTDEQIKLDTAVLFDHKTKQLVGKSFHSFNVAKKRFLEVGSQNHIIDTKALLEKLQSIRCKFSRKMTQPLVDLTKANLYFDRLAEGTTHKKLLDEHTHEIRKNVGQFIKQDCLDMKKEEEEWIKKYQADAQSYQSQADQEGENECQEAQSKDGPFTIILTSQKNTEIQK